jgi:hypothetical protein
LNVSLGRERKIERKLLGVEVSVVVDEGFSELVLERNEGDDGGGDGGSGGRGRSLSSNVPSIEKLLTRVSAPNSAVLKPRVVGS